MKQMAKPSPSRLIILRYFHHTASKSSTTAGTGISQFIAQNPYRAPTFPSWLFNSRRTHSSSSPNTTPSTSRKPTPRAGFPPPGNHPGFRCFSSGNREVGSENHAKKMAKMMGFSAIKGALARYKEATALRIEAFWRRNYPVALGAGGLALSILLWRVLFGVADTFIGLSEGMAEYGLLALSSAIVTFSGLYLNSRFNVNPDKVYRMAMTRLNTSAGILEVMGAPLTGTDLRACVMSGGGVVLRNFFNPGLRNKRCFLIFPIQGSEKKGLVSVEVKKNKGQYDMKLLAVDIPVSSGPDQRLFLIGDEEEYRFGGGLISELRDPVIKALAAAKEFEAHDMREDEVDDQRKLQEAERKCQTRKTRSLFSYFSQ